MELSSSDTITSLVINRLTKDIYNELCAIPGRIKQNELYIVEDDDFDVYDKRIINVKQPINETDAVNLQYIEEQYVQKNKLVDELKNNNVYAFVVEQGLPNGSEYIDRKGDIYKKNVSKTDTSTWVIASISGDYEPSNLKIQWDNSFGWNFYTKSGTKIGGRNTNDLADSITYYNDENPSKVIYLSASSWYKSDKVVRASEIADLVRSMLP